MLVDNDEVYLESVSPTEVSTVGISAHKWHKTKAISE